MEELIVKMIGCLLAALALGFLFGWFIKRAFAKETYEPKIEELEQTLAHNTEIIHETQQESQQIKHQFLTTRDNLEEANTKTAQLQEQLSGYQDQLKTTQKNLEVKEQEVEEKFTEISHLHTELEKSKNSLQELDRVKEHHSILKAEITKLQQKQNEKELEVAQLSQLLSQHADKEAALLEEKNGYQAKLTELESLLHTKNMAALELENKAKEIDSLNIKNSELNEKLQQSQIQSTANDHNLAKLDKKQKEIDTLTQENSRLQSYLKQAETAYTELEHKAQQSLQSAKERMQDTSLHHISAKKRNFDFMTFAKTTLRKITETGEEVTQKADQAIDAYKDIKK